MEKEIKIYSDKIGQMLSKVINGEEVYSKPKDDIIQKKLKEKGIKQVILDVFNESEVPHFIAEESNDEIPDTKFIKVNPPSSYTDVDNYWKEILPFLKRIGKSDNYSSEIGIIDITAGEHNLKFILARDTENSDRPTILIKSDLSPEEVIKLVEKSGLKVDRLEAKKIGDYLILDLKS